MMKESGMKMNWRGLDVEFELVTAGLEGDSSIPNGMHQLPDFLEDVAVYTPEGADITDYLTDTAIDDIIDYILNKIQEKE